MIQSSDNSADRAAIFNEHRPALLGMAYRMLGNVMDAEDIVQDAFIQWQKISAEHILAPKSYLMTVVTHLSIDHLRLARVQREHYVGEWLPEPLMQSLESDPASAAELAESLSMAFLVLLEKLSPLSRAILLLHDVFGYTFEEIAGIVGRSADDCRQIGHRARSSLMTDRPRFRVDRDKAESLVQQFVHAWMEGDMSGLLSVLSEDVTCVSDGGGKVTAARNPVYGADRVARLLVGIHRKYGHANTFKVLQGNGQFAVVEYKGTQAVRYCTFQVEGEHIKGIYFVLNPDKLRNIPPLVGGDPE